MRVLRIDLSNKLTDYGVELLYRKLFDYSHEYDAVFFSDLTTLRKLRLYSRDKTFIESSSEEISISVGNYIQIVYSFENLPSKVIENIVLEDSGKRILDIDLQHISVNDYQIYFSRLEKIICRFVIDRTNNQIRTTAGKHYYLMPIIITDYGIQYIYESLVNYRNEKINYFYSGNGQIDVSGATPHVTSILDDIKVSQLTYIERDCLVLGKKLFSYNTTTLTELGLGFYLNPKRYILHTLASLDNKDFYDDSKKCDSIWSLVYDEPIAKYRISSNDYRCVFLGNYLEHPSELFNNRCFEITFEINLIYSILYDSEQLAWAEDSEVYELTEETITLSDSIIFDSRVNDITESNF